MRMLDLFCGRFGWSKAFAARGWECVGIDLVRPDVIPASCTFIQADILTLAAWEIVAMGVDFICASSPCEQFSVHGLRHFFPNPKHPEMGLKLFNHTREICEKSGIPYVMENVRAAQQFVGRSAHHCGPFYLWGTAVPMLMPQGITKGFNMGRDPITGKRILMPGDPRATWSGSKARAEATAKKAEIPAELANCVVDYAERILDLTPATGATCGTDEIAGARKDKDSNDSVGVKEK